MEIVRENGKIWGIEKNQSYGICHTKKVLLGEYEEEEKETPKKKKRQKKEQSN